MTRKKTKTDLTPAKQKVVTVKRRKKFVTFFLAETMIFRKINLFFILLWLAVATESRLAKSNDVRPRKREEHRHLYKIIERQTGREIDSDKLTDRHRQTDTNTDRQTHRQTRTDRKKNKDPEGLLSKRTDGKEQRP